MRTTLLAVLLLLVVAGGGAPSAQQAQQPGPPGQPIFRSTVNLILVDVVVRDRRGAIVKGLTRDDFQVVEDGKPQQIVTFAYEEIERTAQPIERASLLA